MTRLLLAAIVLASVGCATWPFGPAARLLTRADTLAEAGDTTQALAAYEEFLAKYPDHGAAGRVRMTHDTLNALLTTRGEVARLQSELARRPDREAEITRLRGELARVSAEAERLRGDLEKLKRLDMQMERRRPPR